MRLDDIEKRRLARIILKEITKNYVKDDILCELETTAPKRITDKLGNDVDTPGDPTYIYDRHAQKLINNVFKYLPHYIKTQLGLSQKGTKTIGDKE